MYHLYHPLKKMTAKVSDLSYDGYIKSAYLPDDPRISGEMDKTPFNKMELYEFLFVMNTVLDKLRIFNPIYIKIIERITREFMPKHINNQIRAFNWIILALDYLEL